MFVMLDSLQMDSHPCHIVTQTWLNQALQRGDISRLLEPLLLILLHPDTARSVELEASTIVDEHVPCNSTT